MKPTKLQLTSSILFGLFGVILPFVTLGVEYTTHMCRKDLNYDPIPTLPHIIVVALVPTLLLIWGIQRLRLKNTSSPIWRTTLGTVASISFIYAIPMIPILPFAVIAMIFGIGFLPFAPVATGFIALIAIWKSRKTAMSAENESTFRSFARVPWGILGMVIGFAIMVSLSMSEAQTQRAVELAQTGTNTERAKAISNLRNLPEVVVKNAICDYRRVRGPNPLSPFQNLTLFDDNNYGGRFNYNPELFWKVTGEGCEQGRWSRNARFITRRDNQPGLSFANSRFDGSIDAKAATAYTEWTYTLKNDDTRRREADFIVQLPSKSVVSRVTLWVNGEPREATFAGRGKATAAYEAVVRKAKDPILVSEIGPDRIRIRMFPMLAGKTMKARIGITTPLKLSHEGNSLSLPRVISGNVAHDISHRVWVESKDEMKTPLIRTTIDKNTYQTRGDVSDTELRNLTIKTPFFPLPSLSKKKNLFTTQSFTTQTQKKQNLIFLVDGSVRMKGAMEDLSTAFDSLNIDGEVSLIFVNDAETTSAKIVRQKWSSTIREKMKNELSNFEFVGGRDNSKALEDVQIFSKHDDDIIIWIHAAQPVAFGSALVTSRFTTPIFDLQVDGERDVNLETLHLSGKVEGIARHSSIRSDLATFFQSFSTPSIERNIVYGVHADPTTDQTCWHQTSDHLFRLGARDEVDRLLLASKRDAAIRLAHENQIVTRVSAAVVLETKAQYSEHGLDQANGTGVPTVPEPEEWALMIIGAFFLLFVIWRKRKEEDFSHMLSN